MAPTFFLCLTNTSETTLSSDAIKQTSSRSWTQYLTLKTALEEKNDGSGAFLDVNQAFDRA